MSGRPSYLTPTSLPAGGTYVLPCDTRVDGADLDRFLEAGGTIAPAGYKLFVDGPATIRPGMFSGGAYPDGNGGSGSALIVRQVARDTPLRAGDVVYRVIEVDPAPTLPGPHTWQAAARVVERASAKQIKLKAAFPGIGRVLFDPDAVGRLFFETPLQAVRHFLAERRLEIESLDRKRKEAARAVAWAEGQEGAK